jgi:hypothetical protein
MSALRRLRDRVLDTVEGLGGAATERQILYRHRRDPDADKAIQQVIALGLLVREPRRGRATLLRLAPPGTVPPPPPPPPPPEPERPVVFPLVLTRPWVS